VPSDFLDDHLTAARPHAGSVESTRRLRDLVGASRGGQRALRSPLSLRYAPGILGAFRDAVASCDRVLDVELNAAVDNPLLFEDGWLTSNSGTTSGQRVGDALDALATSLISVAVAAERRVTRLVGRRGDGGAPGFLVPSDAPSGLHSGLMMAQYTAASLVAELRVRSVPASIQSIPTCADSEDHVSMSALAARRLAWAVLTAGTVVAIELLAAAQAVDTWSVAPAAALGSFYRRIREVVPLLVADRVLSDSIQAMVALLRAGAFDAEDAHASG
jgi:histidine ammonia-lyase